MTNSALAVRVFILAVARISVATVALLLVLLAWVSVYAPLGTAAIDGVFLCGLLWLFISDASGEKEG